MLLVQVQGTGIDRGLNLLGDLLGAGAPQVDPVEFDLGNGPLIQRDRSLDGFDVGRGLKPRQKSPSPLRPS